MPKPLPPRPMRSAFDAGVYVIRSASSARVYVGATRCRLSARLVAHWSALRHGRHPNQALQREWDRTGGESFAFEVVERVAPEELAALGEREAWWMDRLGAHDPATGYNSQPGGMSLGPRRVPWVA
ncbi:MAG TPA: GIY-YIG nuclease family protein [Ktedonobacterales bacterium]|nr:GIY-YIG nuclease family protein [Ktedonobacterales bacterium]